MRPPYPTDLTERHWELIKPIVEEKTHKKGRPPLHDKRGIVNAIFYILRSGCAWRLFPRQEVQHIFLIHGIDLEIVKRPVGRVRIYNGKQNGSQ